jgi:hypothetical protein
MGTPSAIVLPFSNCGHPCRIRPVPFKSEQPSARPARRQAPAAARDIVPDRPRPGAVIIVFADARSNGGAKRNRERSSNDNQTAITLLDLAPLAYVLMAAAFYPALAWFLIHS